MWWISMDGVGGELHRVTIHVDMRYVASCRLILFNTGLIHTPHFLYQALCE